MLTPLEIIEGNEKIALFVGCQKTELGWFDAEEVIPGLQDNTFDILHFHESFRWLSPASAKVEEMGYRIIQHPKYVEILNKDGETLIISDEGCRVERLFTAIVLWLDSLSKKQLTVGACVELLKCIREDAKKALNGEWDKSDEGFEEQIIIINAFLYDTPYEE